MKNKSIKDLQNSIDTIIKKYVSEFKLQDAKVDDFLTAKKDSIDKEFSNAMSNSTNDAVQNGHSMESDFVKNILEAKDRGFLKLIRAIKEIER